jgi:hypothetical protein
MSSSFEVVARPAAREDSDAKCGRRPAVFISCLGTSAYSEVTYAPYDGEPEPAAPVTTRFIQLARLESFRQRGIRIQSAYILMTEGERGSASMNWRDGGHGDPDVSGLESCLKQSGIENCTPVLVKDGANESEMWSIFQQVAELLPADADVYVDLTHGFRTQPMVLLLALQYVEKVKGARVVELTYGSLPLKGSDTAPTWNLQPFLVIRDWANAVDSFVRYGDTRPLAECARTPTVALKKALRQDMPASLCNLHKALSQFGEAIQKCHLPGIPQAAANLKALLHEAAEESSKLDRLKPLAPLLGKVERKLAGFPKQVATEMEKLQAKLAAAEWCVQHSLALQSLTFLREGYVCALQLALTTRPEVTAKADELIGYLGRYSAKQPLHEHAEQSLKPLFDNPPFPPEPWQELIRVLASLVALRNKLDHAYNGHDDPEPISAQKLQKDTRDYLKVFRDLVASLQQSGAAAAAVLNHTEE